MPVRKLDIVVPVFNESQTIEEYFRRFSKSVRDLNKPNWKVTLIFVNDGSKDSTAEILERITQSKNRFDVKVLTLSRNFGHQQAVWAGVEHSSRDSCVMVMDADLQDPPEMISNFISGLEECDVVMARRATRNDSAVKKTSASLFYRILGKLSGGAVRSNIGDFWALSERAKVNFLLYKEELKFLRGIVSDLGYQVKIIDYNRDARYAGTTHYTILKMIQLAIAGVTGFTIKPLIYTVYIAIIFSALLLPAAIFLTWNRIFGTSEISPGLTFVGVVVIISISLQFIVMSVLALYVARIAIETKKRPVYILENIYHRVKRR
jgi:dolichol-phosphate mannosyltransferase